jgi:voltage-gated potassium channel Kch
LNPDGKVICRGESHEVEANMRSFGTHAVVDPYDTFAAHLALALHFPYLHQLTDRLAGIAWQHRSPLGPPRGPWVLCGFDRFGKEVYKRLQYEGIRATVVAPDPDAVQCEGNCVVGLGAEAVTLRAAHIDRAMGIVAGTDDDISNLSILVTARELNPGLFTVVRQNRRAHQVIFDAVQADIVMQKGQIVAERIRVMLTMPLLMEFLRVIRREREPWAKALLERIAAVVGDQALRVWEVTVDEDQAHAVDRALAEGRAMLLDHLLRDMSERERMLACLPLMVLCGEERRVLPGADLPLQHGDSLLFCGTPAAASHMQWTLQNPVVLTYVVTGDTHPQGLLWRWWLHGTRRPA